VAWAADRRRWGARYKQNRAGEKDDNRFPPPVQCAQYGVGGQAQAQRRHSGLGFARDCAVSVAAVLALGFLLLISMVLAAGLAAFEKTIGTFIREALVQVVGVAVAFVTIAALFGLIWVYYFAQIVLFGTEFTRAPARRYPARKDADDDDDKLEPLSRRPARARNRARLTAGDPRIGSAAAEA
jgi:hypothetical protein